VVKIHFTYSDNDHKLMADFQQHAEELFRKAGGEVVASMRRGGPSGFPGGPGSPDEASAVSSTPLGSAIHEVGTARMSVNPQDGVLDSFCRTHDIPNLYVFGGNAFPSTGDKHPTLTMMALAARGCDHLMESAKGRLS
jgi:choline dehydrogenase-like flavoprotein